MMMKVRAIKSDATSTFGILCHAIRLLPHHTAVVSGLASFEFGLTEVAPSASCLSSSAYHSADAAMEAAELAALDMAEQRMGSQEAAPGSYAP
jgi:hypothetical protein